VGMVGHPDALPIHAAVQLAAAVEGGPSPSGEGWACP